VSGWLGGVELARPWLLLVGLAALAPYARLRLRRERRWRVPYAPLQYASRRRSRAALGLVACETALLALLLAGAAGPYRESRLELVEDEGIDVALVLDVSLSMLAEDFEPNRLEALRRIARDFIHRSGGNRTAIVEFALDPFVQSPLTVDHAVLLSLLDGVTVHAIDQNKSGGTAIGDAVLAAAELLERSRLPERAQALVLITDGESNSGIDPVLAGRFVSHLGARFYAIGIGGTRPVEDIVFEGRPIDYAAALDEETLREMAAAADGEYFHAGDEGALEGVFARLSRLEATPLQVREVRIRRSLAPLAGLAGLPLFAALVYLAGVRLRRPLR